MPSVVEFDVAADEKPAEQAEQEARPAQEADVPTGQTEQEVLPVKLWNCPGGQDWHDPDGAAMTMLHVAATVDMAAEVVKEIPLFTMLATVMPLGMGATAPPVVAVQVPDTEAPATKPITLVITGAAMTMLHVALTVDMAAEAVKDTAEMIATVMPLGMGATAPPVVAVQVPDTEAPVTKPVTLVVTVVKGVVVVAVPVTVIAVTVAPDTVIPEKVPTGQFWHVPLLAYCPAPQSTHTPLADVEPAGHKAQVGCPSLP